MRVETKRDFLGGFGNCELADPPPNHRATLLKERLKPLSLPTNRDSKLFLG
jgi:hypothetical protein